MGLFGFQKFIRRPIRQNKGKDMYDCMADTAEIVNGGISYGDGIHPQHINGVWVTIPDTGLANTPITVKHNLARIPVGFHIMRKSSAGEVFDSGVAWTNKTISVKSPTAHVLDVILFIF